MENSSLHLILKGSHDFIKGFFFGFFEGKNIKNKPLFIENRHLRNNNDILNNVADFFSMEKKTHIIIEGNILSELDQILSDTSPNIKIISAMPVNSANFRFHFKSYSRKIADELQQILKEIPDEIKIIYYKIQEHINSEKHSSTHKYELYASGSVEGEIKSVLELFYRLELYEIVELGPIKLEVNCFG